MRRPSRRGYGLLELILGLAIMGVVVVAGNRMVQQGQDTQMARGLAQRSTEINAAADAYLRTQIGAIQDALPAAGNRTIVPLTGGVNAQGLPSMQQAGVLGARLQPLGGYGQTAFLVIERTPDVVTPSAPTSGVFNYEAYVVHGGGRPIPDRVLAQASSLADGRTGAILTADPLAPTRGGAARGFKGGWEIPVADVAGFGVAGANQPGRMVSYVSASKGLGAELQGKWLSRINTGDERDNRMETNINAGGNGVNNVGFLTANGIVPNANDNVLPRPTAPGSVNVTGNIVLDATDAINGANPRVEAPKLTSNLTDNARGPDGKPTNPGLTVAGNGQVNDLSTNRLNADTLVYDGTNSRNFQVVGSGAPARLSDLLPRFVMKASYVALDGQLVPKSPCTSAGDTTGARLYVIQDGGQAAVMPVLTTVPTMLTQDVQVVTGVGSDGNGGISVTTSTISLPIRIDIENQSEISPFRTYAFAQDAGSTWQIGVRTFVYNPRTGTYEAYNDEGRNRALVQVMCEYG